MQQQQDTKLDEVKAQFSLELKDITEMLVRHFGLHDGKYDISVEFNVGVGAVGPNENERLPGALIAVSKIGIMPTTHDGPAIVDAAKVNPKAKPRAKPKPKSKKTD